RRRVRPIASEPSLKLLVGAQGVSEGITQKDGWLPANSSRLRAIVAGIYPVTRCITGHKSAVVPPVGADPWTALPGLVLHMRRLVELFVVVNAERESGAVRHRRARAADLWLEKARRHAGENHLRRKSMQIRHAQPARISRNLGVVPFNGKCDRSVSK